MNKIKEIKQLKGNSGCSLHLCKDERGVFVRKTSKDKSYNTRLESQMLKQKTFNNQCIKSPRVKRSGHKEGKLFFDMDFVQGLNLATFLQNSSRGEMGRMFEKLLGFIKSNNFLSTNISGDIKKKINSLKSSEHVPDTPEVVRLFQYCEDFKWESIQHSYCHGDLTLENILIKNDKPHLIDFLDSFGDSRVIDISKLLQDLLLVWSWRHIGKPPHIKLIYLYDQLKESFSTLELEASKRMLALNIIRIFPYCTDYNDSKNNLDRIHFLTNKII